MRVAVLDLGSNSFRLLATDVSPTGGLTTTDRDREMLHLGAVVGQFGYLPQSDVDRSVLAAQRLAAVARSIGADKIFCVATAALREATNGPEVVAMISSAIGCRVDVLSGQREAELSYRGAMGSILLPDNERVLIDLGGGSLELAYGSVSAISHTVSMKLGVSLIHAQIGSPDVITAADEHQVRSIVRKTFSDQSLPQSPKQTVAVGGTVRALGDYILRRQSSWMPRSLNQAVLTRFEIEEAASRLAPLTSDLRIADLVKPSRAAHLPIAGLILSEVLRTMGQQHLILSDWGLREGVVFEHLKVPNPTGDEVRERSVQAIVDQFIDDPTHVNQTAKIVGSLLEQLPDLLTLTAREAMLVDIAARLHSVGRAISLSRSHRHTAYLVENAGLRGLSPYDRAALLSVLYGHRGGGTEPSFPPYGFLTPQHRTRVNAMGAVLQLADALDRTKSAQLTSLEATDDGATVRILLSGLETLPDSLRIRKRTRFFEKTFERRLELTLEI